MASPLDICVLALSHIGDPGQITSINPPDGTPQAARCATFYPIARRTFLESRDWSFATRRTTLADLDDPTGPWLYRYTRPAGALRVSKVLAPTSASHEPTAPFITELDSSGNETILTNIPEAEVVYLFDQTDTTRFTPLCVSAVAFLLGSYLAGPLIKGKYGIQVSEGLLQRYGVELSMAATANASQQKLDRTDVTPSGISARA